MKLNRNIKHKGGKILNKNVFLITALLFLIVSIGAVSAENINQTDDCLEIDSSDALSVGEPNHSPIYQQIWTTLRMTG